MPAKVEHPFRVVKRQLDLLKVRFRRLATSTAHVAIMFRAIEPVDGAQAVDGDEMGGPSESQREARE